VKARSGTRPVLHVAEPRPGYLGRPPIVVDCSVLSAALFDEETREAAWQALGGKTLHAPSLLDSEIVSVATKKHRAGKPDALILRALSRYREQDIELHRPDVEAQYGLVLRYGVSPYDAAYLWLAGFLQAPLATFDAKLAKAARAHLGRA
jgi:predicted nucleic acid-binding protein